jgi:hypothetical protein
VCGHCGRRLGRASRNDAGRLQLEGDGLWFKWGLRDECNHCRSVVELDVAELVRAVFRGQRRPVVVRATPPSTR